MNTSKLPVWVILNIKKSNILREYIIQKNLSSKERLIVYHFQTTKKEKIKLFL